MTKITVVVTVKVMMKIKIKKQTQILTKIKDKTMPVNKIKRNEILMFRNTHSTQRQFINQIIEIFKYIMISFEAYWYLHSVIVLVVAIPSIEMICQHLLLKLILLFYSLLNLTFPLAALRSPLIDFIRTITSIVCVSCLLHMPAYCIADVQNKN